MLTKKRYYEEPSVDVIIFSQEDVLGASDGDNTGELGGGDEFWDWDF